MLAICLPLRIADGPWVYAHLSGLSSVCVRLSALFSSLCRAVRPSELVGSKWTMDNKEELSPNVLKFIRHSSHVSLCL